MNPANDRSNLPLGPGHEFDSIRDLVTRWGEAATGIGDDAAVVELPRGERLVVSVDTFIEGRHFIDDWITPEEIGYRATAAALSDLAAMAARPIGVLFAVSVPDAWRARLGEIGDGVAEAARAVGAKIIGGNTAAAAEFSITTTVVGTAFEPLARRGAVATDRIYVTGALGGPGAAVALWRQGQTPLGIWRERFAHPVPRVHEARWLADRGATSCIDISDGLIADAGHLAAASGRHLTIDIDRLPLVPGVLSHDAARSGEEYELLISAPEIDRDAFAAAFGIPLTAIGSVGQGPPGVTALDRGERVAAVTGHDHFST